MSTYYEKKSKGISFGEEIVIAVEDTSGIFEFTCVNPACGEKLSVPRWSINKDAEFECEHCREQYEQHGNVLLGEDYSTREQINPNQTELWLSQ